MTARLECSDCGELFKAIRSDALRCQPCKAQHRKEYLREYDHGKKRGHCVDCNADVGARSMRCRTCANKHAGHQRRAERNGNWKRGRTKSNGYVYLRINHTAGGAGQAYKAEHRLVWEQANGPLPKGWVVHHLNGVKDDNRIENLAGMPRHEHHSHPRQALVPYEERIKLLEEQVNSLAKGE